MKNEIRFVTHFKDVSCEDNPEESQKTIKRRCKNRVERDRSQKLKRFVWSVFVESLLRMIYILGGP